MIRAFRLWLARLKLRLLAEEIVDTSQDLAHAAYSQDSDFPRIRRDLDRLIAEQRRMREQVLSLTNSQTKGTNP